MPIRRGTVGGEEMKLINISMPSDLQFGTFQVEGLDSTYLRLAIHEGQPILDQYFFLESEQDPDKRQQSIPFYVC
jgi:hypothetical protein